MGIAMFGTDKFLDVSGVDGMSSDTLVSGNITFDISSVITSQSSWFTLNDLTLSVSNTPPLMKKEMDQAIGKFEEVRDVLKGKTIEIPNNQSTDLS
jgi:hypothetical protein